MKYKCFEHRFWSKVDIKASDECWLWTAGKTGGYGILTVTKSEDNRRRTAHAISWVLSFGDIPNHIHVGHKCSQKSCVNPMHLYLTSRTENQREYTRRNSYLYPDTEKTIDAQRRAVVHWVRYQLDKTKIVDSISDTTCLKIFESIREYGKAYSDINMSDAPGIQACGHSSQYVVSSNGGTHYCIMCEYLECSNALHLVKKALGYE